MTEIHLPYNLPLEIALLDPIEDAANFDFDRREGRFRTVDGRVLVLPETATVSMNMVSPQAGEPIQITRVWSGRSCDSEQWVICLSSQAQEARAAGGDPGEPGPGKETTGEAPTPISRPNLRKMPPVRQAPLFEDFRGTGTDGPRARPAIARYRTPPEVIPVNIATREILEFINADPLAKSWGAEAKQDMLSTILIAEYKAKRIGLWERGK